MLKISIIDTSAQCRIVLEGKLIAPWGTELKKAWKRLTPDLGERKVVVDLGDVTFISREGENTLLELMRHGAKFQCRGVFIKHIVQQLTRRHRSGRETTSPAIPRTHKKPRTKTEPECASILSD